MSKKPIDWSGKRVGRWTVLNEQAFDGRNRKWLCRCDCGKEKFVFACHLNTQRSVSCGCRKQRVGPRSHGRGYSDKTYRAWKNMRYRCNNPKCDKFKFYGGRGVRVCEEWNKSFVEFQKDMGDCPEGYSIDRINSNGNYEPSNCKWIPLSSQQKNTRRCKNITALGKTMLLSHWAKELSMYHGQVSDLLSHGWTIEEIVKAKTNPDFKREKISNNLSRPICKRGHKKEGRNLYINSRGIKLCRMCTNATARKYRAKNTLAVTVNPHLDIRANDGIRFFNP